MTSAPSPTRSGRFVPHARSTRVGAALPLIAGVAIMALAVVVSLVVGRSNLESAKETRLDDRTALVERFAATGSAGYQRVLSERIEDGAPFSPVDADWNETVLDGVGLGPTGQRLIGATVIDASGETVGARPDDLVIPPEVVDEFLDTAIEDRAVVSNVFQLDGEPVWAVFNVVGGDEPWGALVMVEPLSDGWLHQLYSALGPAGPGEGGLTTIDRNGIVSGSWDQDRIGTPLAEVPPAGATSAIVSESVVDGETVVRIAIKRDDDASILMYEESEAALYADLVDAQGLRDRLVVAAAVAAILLLVAFSALRHRAVRRSEDRTVELLSHARDLVVVVDRSGDVTFVSPAVSTMLGYDADTIVGSNIDRLLTAEGASASREGVARAVEDGASSVLGVQLPHANGTRLWFDLHMVHRPHPDIDGVLVTCHEVGDRRELEHELHRRARHDGLTRLGNRLAFDEALKVAAAHDGSVAVMMIDLDNFKPLNDSLGHDAGDAALRMVARTMDHQIRHGDVVCRLGGDEFGVIAPDIDLDAATQLAERLVERITEAWMANDNTIPLGASAGVAVGTGPMDRPEHLLREADSAMYQAKLAGGSRVVAVRVSGAADEAHTTSITHGERPADTPQPDEAVMVTPATAPASNRVSESVTVPQRRWQSATTWLFTASIIVGLALGGAHLNEQRIRELEDERIASRTQVVDSISDNVAELVDLSSLPETAASGAWPIEEAPEVVEFILSRWANSGALGDAALAAVTDREGNVLVSHPAGVDLAIGPDDPDWQDALDGRPFMSNLIDDGERLRIYYVIPLRIDGAVDHALVLSADP
ncbi:MAG: diguanylate cyclase domain-containing protein, partial [Acidimicrobiales bacterium]